MKCEKQKAIAKDLLTVAERKKVPSLRTVVSSIIEHKNGDLLKYSVPTMFCTFPQYKKDP